MKENDIRNPTDIKYEIKDIKGFEGLYKVDTQGTIFSTDRIVICKNGETKPVKGRKLCPGNNGTGYMFVQLWKNNIPYRKYIHRLVAESFINNPNNLEEVNHIDGNKSNNSISNLEWCNRLWNERCKKKHISGYPPMPIIQTDENDRIINEFESVSDCSKQLHHNCKTIHDYINKNKVIHKDNKTYKLKYKYPTKTKVKLDLKSILII